jgi:hypothetical protein
MLLQFVQIVDSIAVIDSRVYCEKIIEVKHSDWMQNIVEPYRSEIEQEFGIFRFANGEIDGRGRPEKYLLATEDQISALLVFSRNTAKVRKQKLALIRELSEARKFIRQRLERQLSLTVSDVPGYTHTLDTLWKDSGIVNRWQVKQAVTRDFVEGKHYYIENGVMQITETCYLILMLNFRSKRGSDVSRLPSLVKIDKEELFQYEQRKRANTRNPQKYCDPMQLSLFSE